MKKNISYNWNLSQYPKPNGLKVFGTFICGGGSTMGYKLAGYEHLGGVEIDKRMSKLYAHNHKPKYIYEEDLRVFNDKINLPSELYDLDILDGSPPCTTFSMCGKREETWGMVKKFKEGQQSQRLDDLVFVYCDTIEKLKPKVAILENVTGILAGRAKGYTIEIVERLEKAGYSVQIFQLNSATMGVPQSRERVFFIARRNDLNLPKLVLDFNVDPVPFGTIADKGSTTHKKLWPSIEVRWPYVEHGDQNMKFADAKYRNKETCNAFFSTTINYDNIVSGTLTSSGTSLYWNEVRNLNDIEYQRMSSFPSDYNFLGYDVRYICGMSVPPLMTYSISSEIAKQWFKRS